MVCIREEFIEIGTIEMVYCFLRKFIGSSRPFTSLRSGECYAQSTFKLNKCENKEDWDFDQTLQYGPAQHLVLSSATSISLTCAKLVNIQMTVCFLIWLVMR